MEELFDIQNFNIIQDEENYYFFRALNMADNSDIDQGITVLDSGEIERIRTDRERYEEKTKYTENSQISLEELHDHIKTRHRTDTNCISLTSNANVAINYGRGSYKDKYVMVKVPKAEFGQKTVVAGQHMLRELSTRIEQAVNGLDEAKKQKVLEAFTQIEGTENSEKLQEIIANRYTSPKETTPKRAKKQIKRTIYNGPKTRISNYQSLSDKQLLEANKSYAKLAILENEHALEHVIPHVSNSNLRKSIGSAFSSLELIHYGEIQKDEIIEVPKEVVDIFALIQQIDGIDEGKIEELKIALISAVQNGREIPSLEEITGTAKDNITIEEMYEQTKGLIEYGKSSSIVKNMFFLSKARKNAIGLSNILNEVLGHDQKFAEIIEYIRDNGLRVEPEIISRVSGNGIKLSEAVNLDLKPEEQALIDEIKELSSEQLEEVIQSGGLLNIGDIITKTYGMESSPIDKERYYAEAIVSQYDWGKIGIAEFRLEERNELVRRLQERNCVALYNELKQAGIEEKQIPTYTLNILARQGLYEQYQEGQLNELLSGMQDVLQDDINVEVVERFLGYYDTKNSGIELKDYQQKAFDNVSEIFKEKKFAQVILPTGAGKSFVALKQMQKYAEEHPNEKMLYLAPQEEIINQIKKYIVNNIHGKKETVNKSIDAIIAEVFPNITFEIYPRLLMKKSQNLIKEQYGMIVLDELHRTGAKKGEGKIDELFSNQDENVKVLGITATPVRDADGMDMAEENARKLGYTDEEIKDRKHLASNLTLENAIRLGYDNGEIDEDEMSEEDVKKLIAMYEKETEEINNNTLRIKNHIEQMLKELKTT